MEKIKFIEHPVTYFNEDEFIACISKIVGKTELLVELGRVLNFPDYFGNNWDALYDCLRDFSWIEQRGIVLVHTELPILSDVELTYYFQILIASVRDWQNDDEHYFKVIFPKEAESNSFLHKNSKK